MRINQHVKNVLISTAHQLPRDLSEKCSALHGHNFVVDIKVIYTANTAEAFFRMLGHHAPFMLVDFARLKACATEFDHNIMPSTCSTAEDLALHVMDRVRGLVIPIMRERVRGADRVHCDMRIRVAETPNNVVELSDHQGIWHAD